MEDYKLKIRMQMHMRMQMQIQTQMQIQIPGVVERGVGYSAVCEMFVLWVTRALNSIIWDPGL